MPLPNLHIAAICKLGKGIKLQNADFLGINVSLRE
jgi:hypothetical protein